MTATPYPARTEEFFHAENPDDPGAADAEWTVYSELLARLDKAWILFSSVVIRLQDNSNTEREIDIVLIHPEFGVVIGEVKSRKIYSDKVAKASRQLGRGKSFLKALLVHRNVLDESEFRRIRSFVACPDSPRRPHLAEIPPGLHDSQIIVEDELGDLADIIENRICNGPEPEYKQLGRAKVLAIIEALDENLRIGHSDEALKRAITARVDREVDERVRNLLSLDLNHRVFVDGGAGTGKTWLATEWVRKAASQDGQRVLFTCYNEALADGISQKLGSLERVTVGAFLRHVEQQLGRPRREAKLKEDLKDYWDALMDEVAIDPEPVLGRFDVIVVDEIQDFETDWIDFGIPWLLKDGGKLLAVGDLNQNVRKIDVSHLGDASWTRARLTTNLRNPSTIARFAERFGGAPKDGPDALAEEVKIIGVRDEADFLAQIMPIVARVPSNQREQTWILTSSRGRRELLKAQSKSPQMVSWGKGSDGVVCVTAEHVKGLETAHIVLVILEAPDSDAGLDEIVYAGATRSTETLTIITTDAAKEMLDRDEPVDWGSALWPKTGA